MKNLEILDRLVPNYSGKFSSGQFSSDEMPLLEAIGGKFSPELNNSDLSRVYIVACQHLLEPQLRMFQLMIKLGISASNIIILPKVYSANQEIAGALKEHGCRVIKEAFGFKLTENFDDFHEKQCQTLAQKILGQISNEARLIVLDDGGMLIREFSKHRSRLSLFQDRPCGVEQTSSGKNILLSSALPIFVANVAGSTEKITIETNYIIRHSMIRISDYFQRHGVDETAKILVLGKGPIGRTLIKALLEIGYICVGYDILEGTTKPTLKLFDVIIGASGSRSLEISDLKLLKRNCHLLSVSSSDREFPGAFIRGNSISGEGFHDTFVYEKNDIHLANGGFPISFKGEKNECLPIEMDVMIMKLTEAVFLCITNQTKLESSINQQYFDRVLMKLSPLINLWWSLFMGYIIYGLFISNSELFFQPPKIISLTLLVIGSVPGFWAMWYSGYVQGLTRRND